jgi:hypothetical protein
MTPRLRITTVMAVMEKDRDGDCWDAGQDPGTDPTARVKMLNVEHGTTDYCSRGSILLPRRRRRYSSWFMVHQALGKTKVADIIARSVP